MEVKKITKPADVMYREVMFDDGEFLEGGYVPEPLAIKGQVIDGRTIAWLRTALLTEQEYFELLLDERSFSGEFLAETRKF